MSSIDERRATFQRYKENVKKRGKPFYPFAMLEDTVMSLVVVVVIGLYLAHFPDKYYAQARFLMVLIAGLAHVDTLYPALARNADWRTLVMDVVAMLLGLKQHRVKSRV